MTKNPNNGAIHRLEDTMHQVVLRVVRNTIQAGHIDINTDRCKGCGLCVATCPAHTLQLSSRLNKRGFHFSQQIEPQHCIGCMSCALVCPDAVISVYRR